MAEGRPLRVGVAGCGQMGRKHALNCSRLEGVTVSAVADQDPERAEAVAAGVGAKVYQSAEAMLANTPLDALIVATPPGVRREIVRKAAGLGIAIFMEKPMALDLPTARECCAAVQRAGVVNSVGFQLRYSPLTRKARALVANRKVTHVRTACTTPYYLTMPMPPWFLQRQHSGGPLLEQAVHVFDAARYLVGEITGVFARGDRLVRPEMSQFDSEDTIVVAYRFANGTLGVHTDSCAMLQFNWEVELLGPDWRLLVDYARRCLRGHMGEEVIEAEMTEGDWHMLEMQAFLAAARAEETAGVLSDFADATRTLAVVLSGDRSLRTGMWEPVTQ